MQEPTTTSTELIETAFLDDPHDDSLSAILLRRLAGEFETRGHDVEALPADSTDVVFAAAQFGVPIGWRDSLQLTVRRRFKLRRTPITYAVMSATPAQLQAMIDHFRVALAKSPIDPVDFAVEGLEPTAVGTLVEQGRRGGAMLTVMRVLQTQAKNVRILLFVGDDSHPEAVFHLDLVGGHPRTLAVGDGSALWEDIVARVLATISARDVTDHMVDSRIVTADEWKAAPARTAMKTAGLALGQRRFFTQMIRVADLIAVPAVDDAIARQYSEGCFATWDTTLGGLVTTVTGSARPVDKTGLADDDLAVIVDVRADGRGVIVRHVDGGENAPPSSEALELRDVDTDLPKVVLGPEWGTDAGATVPVIRSKLHGHRGVRSFDPARVEFVSLPALVLRASRVVRHGSTGCRHSLGLLERRVPARSRGSEDDRLHRPADPRARHGRALVPGEVAVRRAPGGDGRRAARGRGSRAAGLAHLRARDIRASARARRSHREPGGRSARRARRTGPAGWPPGTTHLIGAGARKENQRAR